MSAKPSETNPISVAYTQTPNAPPKIPQNPVKIQANHKNTLENLKFNGLMMDTNTTGYSEGSFLDSRFDDFNFEKKSTSENVVSLNSLFDRINRPINTEENKEITREITREITYERSIYSPLSYNMQAPNFTLDTYFSQEEEKVIFDGNIGEETGGADFDFADFPNLQAAGAKLIRKLNSSNLQEKNNSTFSQNHSIEVNLGGMAPRININELNKLDNPKKSNRSGNKSNREIEF